MYLSVLSIRFEVDVPTGKVQCRQQPTFRAPKAWACCLEMLFLTFSTQYLGLKNNQNRNYINHILCLLQLFLKIFGTDVILAHAKAWDLVLWKCPRRSTTLRSCLLYFRRKVNMFKTPEMRLYFNSDVWGGCLAITTNKNNKTKQNKILLITNNK